MHEENNFFDSDMQFPVQGIKADGGIKEINIWDASVTNQQFKVKIFMEIVISVNSTLPVPKLRRLFTGTRNRHPLV